MPETSATSQRTSANFPPASFSAGDAPNSQASESTRIDEDVEMWRRLKVTGRENLPVPEWYSENEVRSNNSKIQCAKNDCTIKIAADNDATLISIPIHAHSVEQLPAAEPSAGDTENLTRAKLTYAAGQSPTKHNYKNMLIQGIESGLGTFQMVSTRAHRHGSDSKETPLIDLLKAGWNDRSNPFVLSDRYQVTKLKKIAGDYNKSDDHVRYEMTLVDKQNRDKVITVPLTQAALPFTKRVLQPREIKRAHDFMQAHCDACADYAGADVRDLKWKNLMVLSHAGYGRNATVITYCRIAALAEQDAPAVDENNLCTKLEEAIRTGMESRDPNFVYSQPQMSALRKALENLFSEKKLAARQMPRDDSAQRRRLNTRMHETGSTIHAAAAAAKLEPPLPPEPEPIPPAATPPSAAQPPAAQPSAAQSTAAQTTATRAPIPVAQTPAPALRAVEKDTSELSVSAVTATTAAPTMPDGSTVGAPSAANLMLPTPDLTELQQRVVNFFTKPTEPKNSRILELNISTVMAYSYADLEGFHDFIQRLFPIDKVSNQQNVNEPVLDGKDFLALRGNPLVSKGLDEAFDRMLKFFGLKWEGKNIVVHESEQAKKCFEPQQLPKGHNNLRASRIIRSMALFGKADKAQALHTFLKDFCAQNFPDHTSLGHWEDALNDPVAMNKPSTDQPDYPGLLFPNKSLLESPKAPELKPIKKTLFEKQQEFYDAACLDSQHIAPPLIARFTKSTICAGYADNEYLKAPFAPPNTCDISSHRELYFCLDAQDSAPSSPHPPYEVHVDFANQNFGGTWKHDGSFAQEEVAFVENIGLARVADQARRDARRKTPLPQPLPHEQEIAYPTRLENCVPCPIIIEGCERVAHLNAYGGKAAELGARIVEPKYFKAVTPPKSSNWLAIAAPFQSLKRDFFAPYRDLDTAWMKGASLNERTTAFDDLFRTAHAGFSMAKKLAGHRPLTLHTGRLGCGVFNNSVTLSIAAQLLAAKVVGVDRLHFYDVKNDTEKFNNILKIVSDCTQNSERNKPVRELVDNMLKKLFATTSTGAAS